MHQVLFRLPIVDWPIYGYGMMLFLAYVTCTWMACWLAKKEGIPPQPIYDVGIWIFLCGIAGARITFMIQYDVPIKDFFALWTGGLIFYGSAIGGVIGYFGGYYFVLRKYKISSWKMADVFAPCCALGLCLGRVGCLLNGCCFGNVACPDCPAIEFPMPTSPRFELVAAGYQTAAGFTMADGANRVARVEPDSPAYRAGLRDGDTLLELEGKEVGKQVEPFHYIGSQELWPRGKNDLTLKVRHRDGTVQDVGPFVPLTIGLHPTQVYESISMAILFFLLLAYYPYRRHAGEVMVLFMLCYAVHRFLNEILRNDTKPVAFDMTLSQNVSIIVFTCGVALWLVLKFSGKQLGSVSSPPAPSQ